MHDERHFYSIKEAVSEIKSLETMKIMGKIECVSRDNKGDSLDE